jgi:hypothetical protein
MPYIPPMQPIPKLIGGKVPPALIGEPTIEDDDFGNVDRQINLDIIEGDTINVKIRMVNGTVGQITIKGSTIAQVILDRNASAQQEEQEDGAVQVGDDDLGGSAPASRSVTAEALVNASLKRRQMSPY